MHRIEALNQHLQPHPTASNAGGFPRHEKNSAIVAKYLQRPEYKQLKEANKHSLKGYTLFVTGASRGIGLAIALAAAKDGANVVVAAKTAQADKRLPGTIFTAAEEIEKAGGKALPLQVDVRSEDAVKEAVQKAVEKFGGIDILINNASAINLTDSQDTTMKKHDLMMSINHRGTFLVSKYVIPHLRESAKKGRHPQVLNLGPPLFNILNERWFAPHTAYSIAKFNMSLQVQGLAAENREYGVGFNSIWPLTIIATAAVQNLLGGDDSIARSRTPEIMADAAYAVLTSDPKQITGYYFLDEPTLRAIGVNDFVKYRVNKKVDDEEMGLDFFI